MNNVEQDDAGTVVEAAGAYVYVYVCVHVHVYV